MSDPTTTITAPPDDDDERNRALEAAVYPRPLSTVAAIAARLGWHP